MTYQLRPNFATLNEKVKLLVPEPETDDKQAKKDAREKRKAVMGGLTTALNASDASQVATTVRAGKSFAALDRLPEQDAFGLAVLIFQLLMEGIHPFAGVYRAEGEPPNYADRTMAGHFPYSPRPGIPCQPLPTALPFSSLAQPLRELFMQCFEAGHARPLARPVAVAWQNALDQTARSLTVCPLQTVATNVENLA